MSLFANFALLALVSAASSPNTPEVPGRDLPQAVMVRGLLYADIKYPSFPPDNLAKQQVLPFLIKEERWWHVYLKPVYAAYKDKSGKSVCFHIVGEGYVTKRTSTITWPRDQQFIFTKVIKLKKLESDAECTDRIKNGS